MPILPRYFHCILTNKNNTIYLKTKPFSLGYNIVNTINSSNSDPIGIFDSGVGGLSIAKYIAKELPHEKIIYVADTLYAPYGDKPVDFIIERVNLIAKKLIDQGVKAIVVACNTATVNAIEQLRRQVNIPIIGVEPAIKPAAKLSKTKKVAILATQATSENQRFKRLIEKHHNGAQVYIQPCPGLVEFIEHGNQDTAACTKLLTRLIKPLVNQGIDTLVLGCTHYPFILKQIKSIIGEQVTVIETAAPVTLQLANKLAQEKISAPANECKNNQYQFYSTQYSLQQADSFSLLWEGPLTLMPLK